MSENRIQIAVVDDDESFARAIGRLLRASGFDTAIYHSAEDFLRDGAARRVGCLVADVQLGGMSGFDLARRLVQEHFSVPLIFVTALETEESSREARQLGCTDFFHKPVSGRTLLAAIRHAIAFHEPSTNQ